MKREMIRMEILNGFLYNFSMFKVRRFRVVRVSIEVIISQTLEITGRINKGGGEHIIIKLQ